MFSTTATALPRIMQCNGSVVMPPAFPNMDIDRTLRDEGDAAHWAAKEVFDGRVALEELAERKAPNGVHITSEMIEHVSSYLSALDCGSMEIDTSFGTDAWRINARADHISYFDQVEQINGGNGTVLEQSNWTLTVDDLKYGWRPIEPEDNWTLIAHAIGFCLINQIQPDVVCLRIHQPRPHHPAGKLREWRLSYAELCERYATINDTLTNLSTTLQTGPSCTHCHAEANCPARRKSGYNSIDAAEHAAFDDSIPDDALAYELDVLKQGEATLKSRREALEELAKYRIGSGAVIGGYALEHQYGHTKWKPGIDAAMLAAISGLDLSKPGVQTPAEAKRRGMSDQIYKALTERPSTGIKLVRRNIDAHASKLLGSK